MTLYTVLLSTHVVVAILGLGQLAALAILAKSGTPRLATLIRNSRIALVLMLLTGVGLNLAAGRVWHELWWFQASEVLLLIVAVLSWLAGRAMKRNALTLLQRTAWAMCGIVGVITVLMEVKPS